MPVTSSLLALIMFKVAIIGVIAYPTLWLILSLTTPKRLLTRYFKQPHFTLVETYMMREFPGFLIRTMMWAGALIFPRLYRNRGMSNVQHDMPLWYAIALRVLFYGGCIILLVFFGLMGLLLLVSDYGPDYVFFTLPKLG